MIKTVITLCLITNLTWANDDFISIKVSANFNDAWYSLADAIEQYGYTTAYLQRCDIALKQRNYQSDKYRILFFGEYENMAYLSKKYPAIVPFIPLKVVVAEEKSNISLVANSPKILLEIIKDNDVKIIHKWQSDMEKIFATVKNNLTKLNHK